MAVGIDVKYTRNPGAGMKLVTAARRGLLDAGAEVLAASDVLAPREPVPKHGVHMIETGFVRLMPGADGDTVVIGYRAFWAILQNEDLTYHHEHGGQAKFLDTAVAGGAEVALETIAARIRAAIG